MNAHIVTLFGPPGRSITIVFWGDETLLENQWPFLTMVWLLLLPFLSVTLISQCSAVFEAVGWVSGRASDR